MGDKKRLAAVSLFLLYLGLLIWRFAGARTRVFPSGAEIEMIIVLNDEPEASGRIQKFGAEGLRVKTSRYPEYHYGDCLKIRGLVGNHQNISFPVITRLEKGQGGRLRVFLLRWRRELEAAINQNLPSPQSSLLIGMLLGIKNLSQELSFELKRSGLIHIVVASGSNVNLVGSFFLYLSGLIERKKALILSVGAIFFYTLMVGAEPPILRAALMGSLAFGAKILGRQSHQLIALVLVAGLMLLVNPFYIFDLSFQLSFLATTGIVLFAPLVLGFLRGMGRGLASAVATTVSAQVFVVPLLVFRFGEWSALSLLTNVLIYPVVEPVMILGFPFAVLGMISSTGAKLLAPFLWLALTYFIKVAYFFGNLEIGMLKTAKLPPFIIFPYYSILIYLWFRFRDKEGG